MKSSSQTINQGQQANRNGSNLEGFVSDMLVRAGYTEVTKPHDKCLLLCNPPGDRNNKIKVFASQALVGETIYGTKNVADFLLVRDGVRSVIECKWQSSNGSVDEKFPYLVACIDHCKISTIVLLDGGGYKDGAKRWLEAQVKTSTHLEHVVDTAGMLKLFNAGLFD